MHTASALRSVYAQPGGVGPVQLATRGGVVHCGLGSAGVHPLRHKFVSLDSFEQPGFPGIVTC